MAGLCPYKYIRNNKFTNKHYVLNEDAIYHPWNPIILKNPWFRIRTFGVNIKWKPIVEKTRSIASLR